MKLFLDLEETIIVSWNDLFLCNVGAIRDFIKKNGVTHISIFSFAIYDEKDKRKFDDEIRPMIEQALDVKVMSWPSLDDLKRVYEKHRGIVFERFEIQSIVGKQQAFFNYCESTQNEDCVLIDDVVSHKTVVFHDLGFQVTTLNVMRNL